MTRILFTVPGQPVGQGRPRFARRGKYVATYDPKKSRNYKSLVTMCCQRAYSGKPIDCPTEVHISAYFEVPKSYSKKRREECLIGHEFPTKKPDIDNIIKGILDAMNGVAYADDKNIICIQAMKWYAKVPKVEVEVIEREK